MNTMKQCISYIYIYIYIYIFRERERDFKTAYDSVRSEVLYSILIEFGIPMKLVRLIKMCLNEIYSRFRVGKYLSDIFPVKNGLKQDMLYRYCFSTLL